VHTALKITAWQQVLNANQTSETSENWWQKRHKIHRMLTFGSSTAASSGKSSLDKSFNSIHTITHYEASDLTKKTSTLYVPDIHTPVLFNSPPIPELF